MRRAWILTCRACRAELSRALTELELDADPLVREAGRDMLPAGCLWRVRSGVAELAIMPGDLLCCRGDLLEVELRGGLGCCGPHGDDGPNLCCACGAAFATEFGDCWQPHIVSVDPRRVTCTPATPEVGVHVYTSGTAHPSAWAFAAWVHEVLGCEDWYGLDLELLAQDWAGRQPTPQVLVWLDAARDEAAGVPVRDLVGRLAGFAMIVPIVPSMPIG